MKKINKSFSNGDICLDKFIEGSVERISPEALFQYLDI